MPESAMPGDYHVGQYLRSVIVVRRKCNEREVR
jgi:hypothetical protein